MAQLMKSMKELGEHISHKIEVATEPAMVYFYRNLALACVDHVLQNAKDILVLDKSGFAFTKLARALVMARGYYPDHYDSKMVKSHLDQLLHQHQELNLALMDDYSHNCMVMGCR